MKERVCQLLVVMRSCAYGAVVETKNLLNCSLFHDLGSYGSS